MTILDEIVSLPMRLPQCEYEVHQIFFSDLLTNKYSNYVIQTSFENSDKPRRQLMVEKIQETLNSIPNVKESSLKHIIKSLKKHDIHLKGNCL